MLFRMAASRASSSTGPSSRPSPYPPTLLSPGASLTAASSPRSSSASSSLTSPPPLHQSVTSFCACRQRPRGHAPSNVPVRDDLVPATRNKDGGEGQGELLVATDPAMKLGSSSSGWDEDDASDRLWSKARPDLKFMKIEFATSSFGALMYRTIGLSINLKKEAFGLIHVVGGVVQSLDLTNL